MDPLSMTLYNPQAELERGDLMVTLGSKNGRPFVPGIPVGTVLTVRSTPGALTRSADVVPFVDVTTLSVVGVVVEASRTDPRDALLPTPTTAPTPTPTSPSPTPSGTTSP